MHSPNSESLTGAAFSTRTLALTCVVGAVVSYVSLKGYVFEDAYISMRYAQNLAGGQGLVFNPGERVLGTSSPLWTLLLALAGWCGINIELAADVGFAVSLGALAFLGGVLLGERGAPGAGRVFAVAICFGFGGLHAYWGAETPLFMALVFAAVWFIDHQRAVAAGLVLGAAILTRHEGGAFAVTFLAAMSWRVSGRLVAVSCTAVVLPWTIFAWLSFGSPIPNTLAAKASDMRALDYLIAAIGQAPADVTWPWSAPWSPSFLPGLATALLIGLAVGAALALVQRRSSMLPLALGAALILIGLALIAPGLSFRWHRFGVLVVLLLIGCLGWSRLAGRRAAKVAAFSPLLLLALPTVLSASAERLRSTSNQISRIHAYDEIADFLLGTGLSAYTLMTPEPGYIAYRTGVRVFDVAGLVTRGVRVTGQASERTQLADLLDIEPDMIMARAPFEPRGYTIVFEGPMGRRLLLRDDLARLHVAEIEGWSARDDMPLSKASEGLPPFGSVSCLPEAAGSPDAPDARVLRCVGIARTVTVETGLFSVDVDQLAMRFWGTHPQRTRVQLVIRGQVVLEAGGLAPQGKTGFVWDLRPWRGRVARVRLLLIAGGGDELSFQVGSGLPGD